MLMDKHEFKKMVAEVTPLVPSCRQRLFFTKQHLITKNIFSNMHTLASDPDPKKKQAQTVKKLTELS